MPYRHHYDPNQPRVPAGHSDGGQWTDGGFGADPRIQQTLLGRRPTAARAPGSTPTPLLQQAFRRPPSRIRPARPTPAPTPPSAPGPRPDPGPPPERTLLDAALAIFTWLSGRNNRDRKPVISFKAQDYRSRPGEGGGLYLERLEMLNEAEVKKVCNKLETVQKHTDAAADEWRPYRGDLTATDYGTFVHVELKNQIEKLNDPDLKAEVSIKKADQVPPGEKKAIRVDAIENLGGGTFCVYDVKTGREGLTLDRMDEIAGTIAQKFKQKPIRILVIEVRPTR